MFSEKAIRSPSFVDSRKVPKLVWKILPRDHPDTQGVIKLVSLMKGSMNQVARSILCDHHEIDIEEQSMGLALRIFDQSNLDRTCIDYDDMLWLPLFHGIPFAPWDWIFTDECQDTNEVQSEFLWKLARKGSILLPGAPSHTRFVFVGDPHQAIYGFRGAQSDAMTKLKERFSCQTLPLSISYRCPKAVVQEAQKYI